MKYIKILQHFAAYVPYSISLEVDFNQQKYLTTCWGVRGCSDYPISEWDKGVRKGLMFSQVKLILHPISDMGKEMVYKGVKIRPADVLGWDANMVKRRKSGDSPIILNETYENCQFLLELGFDIFGLIEKGYAIDINTSRIW